MTIKNEKINNLEKLMLIILLFCLEKTKFYATIWYKVTEFFQCFPDAWKMPKVLQLTYLEKEKYSGKFRSSSQTVFVSYGSG